MFDKKDQQILMELQRDAGQSVLQIARKLRILRSTVQHRIDRMKANQIIKRLVVIPDYPKIGLPVTAFVLVSFAPTAGVSQHDVARAIAKLAKVVEVHVVAGQWDFILKTRGASLQEIGQLVVNELRQIPGVGQTVTSGSFFTVKEEP
ncbi:MAG: Lrp/AsnC family transcriptional regulator [Candidatus Thorarchaeota archaeon]